MALTAKQARFVEEYLIDLNATQAAIRAGYSERTANQQGARLLVNVKVAAAIAEGKKARSERLELSQDWILGELKNVYDASMEGRPIYDKNGQEKGFSFNPTAANRSLELLGKHAGLFDDKLKIGADKGGRVTFVMELDGDGED